MGVHGNGESRCEKEDKIGHCRRPGIVVSLEYHMCTMCVCVCVSTGVCVYVWVCAYVCICAYTFIRVYMYTCPCVVYVSVYVYAYYMYVLSECLYRSKHNMVWSGCLYLR